MFGLPSIAKLLVLALILLVVYLASKIIGRGMGFTQDKNQIKNTQNRHAHKANENTGAKRGKKAGFDDSVTDMVECKICHKFMPAKSAKCERTDCPQ